MAQKINKKPYGENGVIDFSKLWILLEKKNKNKQWLRNNGIHSNTVSKLAENGNVSCEVIANLCTLLNCQPGQIMEFKPADPEKNNQFMNPPVEDPADQDKEDLPFPE